MDIARKLQIARQAIDSIATHDDADAGVLKIALASIGAYCAGKCEGLDARVAAEGAQALGQSAAE